VYLAQVQSLLACPLLWILRDEFGPGTVDTKGWPALREYSPMLLIRFVLRVNLAILHFLAWWLGGRKTFGSEPN
jgi:hypothetical protein